MRGKILIWSSALAIGGHGRPWNRSSIAQQAGVPRAGPSVAACRRRLNNSCWPAPGKVRTEVGNYVSILLWIPLLSVGGGRLLRRALDGRASAVTQPREVAMPADCVATADSAARRRRNAKPSVVPRGTTKCHR